MSNFTDKAWVADFEKQVAETIDGATEFLIRKSQGQAPTLHVLAELYNRIANLHAQYAELRKDPQADDIVRLMVLVCDLAMAGILHMYQRLADEKPAAAAKQAGAFEPGPFMERATEAGYAVLVVPQERAHPMFAGLARAGMTGGDVAKWMAVLVYGAEASAAMMVSQMEAKLKAAPGVLMDALQRDLRALRAGKHETFSAATFADMAEMENKAKLPRRCGWNMCGKPATHIVGLLLVHDSGAAAPAELAICVCPGCGPQLTIENVVGDDAWNTILAGFSAAGKAAPERSKTELRLIPFAEASDEIVGRFQKADAGAAGGGGKGGAS